MARSTPGEYREAGVESTLDDDWIVEVDRDPEDADWFLAIAEDLIAGGEAERARSLLELWDDELRRRGLWQARLGLLRQFGPQIFKPARLQKEIVGTLEGLWAGKAHLEETLGWVGLRKSVDDPAKLWDRVTRAGSILLYDVGEVVAMKGQGVGRVCEVNLALETLKIDFGRPAAVSVGFRAAPKLLRVLSSDDLLRRKLEDPESLATLRDEQPSELLRAALQGAEHPLSAAEIREALTGVVDEKQWPSWWSAARRHPQVVIDGTGRQSYRWEASAAGALDAVRRAFDDADPRRRIEIFRKNHERDSAFGRELAGRLAAAAGEAVDDEPGLAWEIFFALERAGLLPPALTDLADRLTADGVDPRPLLAGISDRLLRERAIVMLRERRREWPRLFHERMMSEEDPRVLSILADGLVDGDPDGLGRIYDDVLAQPRKTPPLFVWLAERAADDERLRSRAPLRLLQQAVGALADEPFSPYRSRLLPLFESGGTVPRLLAHLDEEQAGVALELLDRAHRLEPYQRDSLAAALRLRFPALGSAPADGPLYATSGSIVEKRDELKRLVEVEIPANRKAIEEARALGDLRENFEYKSARQRHEYLNSRVATLHRELARARPIEIERLDTSEVRIGALVELTADGDLTRRFSVLGPWDSRPERGVISYESELGRELLGKRIGDEVRIGETPFRVASIAPAR